MQSPPLDPPISDLAPTDSNLTGYDQQHLVTYLRLLDADAEGTKWHDVAKIVLHIDPEREPDLAKRVRPTKNCSAMHLQIVRSFLFDG